MYSTIVDKMDFLESHINAMIDEYHEEDNMLTLSNGSFVIMDDVRCVHHYKAGKLEETADMSVEYRDYMLAKYKQAGDKYALMNYCRKCIVAIEEEYLKVVERCVGSDSELDAQACREQADRLNDQANNVTIMLSHSADAEYEM